MCVWGGAQRRGLDSVMFQVGLCCLFVRVLALCVCVFVCTRAWGERVCVCMYLRCLGLCAHTCIHGWAWACVISHVAGEVAAGVNTLEHGNTVPF